MGKNPEIKDANGATKVLNLYHLVISVKEGDYIHRRYLGLTNLTTVWQ